MVPALTRPPLESAAYSRLSALQQACRDPRELERALAGGMDPNIHFDFNHESRPLFAAINAKPWRSASILLLLEAGADPNIADDRGHSPMRSALSHAHHGGEAFEMARLLASCTRLAAPPGDDLLSLAFYAPPLIELLVERGYDPNALCEEAKLWLPSIQETPVARPTCLARCASFGTTGEDAAIRALIAHGASPNDDRGGVSPLAYAILGSGTADGIEALLRAGADPLWSILGMDCLAMAKARLDQSWGTYAEPLRAGVFSRIEPFHRARFEQRFLGKDLAPGLPAMGSKAL